MEDAGLLVERRILTHRQHPLQTIRPRRLSPTSAQNGTSTSWSGTLTRSCALQAVQDHEPHQISERVGDPDDSAQWATSGTDGSLSAEPPFRGRRLPVSLDGRAVDEHMPEAVALGQSVENTLGNACMRPAAERRENATALAKPFQNAASGGARSDLPEHRLGNQGAVSAVTPGSVIAPGSIGPTGARIA